MFHAKAQRSSKIAKGVTESFPSRSLHLLARLGETVAALLLLVWLAWWFANLVADHFVGGSKTWIPRYHFLAVDFLHNYHAVQAWWNGGNPYLEPFNPTDPSDRYVYPPLALRVFSWCAALPPQLATAVWIIVLGGIASLAALHCWGERGELGLWRARLPAFVASFLWSTPVLFAMERGNYDLLVLGLVLAAGAFLSRRYDILAGVCLAVAAWLKVYPALAGLTLVVLWRPRAILAALAAGLIIVLLDIPGTADFLYSLRVIMPLHVPTTHGVMHETMHTITGCWGLLWAHTPLDWLAVIPGQAAWAVLMLPPVAWVSYRLARCATPEKLLVPYLLWVTAVATFLPSVSNDYNLVFLPLAGLTVWDRRDPVLAHVLLALMVVWWQPFLLPVGPRLLFVCKLAGVYGVAVCLVGRLTEQGVRAARVGDGPSDPIARASGSDRYSSMKAA
jgi:Glycosyltransferase family 87